MILTCFMSILLFVVCFQCQTNEPDVATTSQNMEPEQAPISVVEVSKSLRVPDRLQILTQLEAKIEAGQPLLVHVFLPLCDNDHQGIVPVPASLGNGLKPASNLYWGAMYGLKSFFRRAAAWQKLSLAETKTPAAVLERVVFKTVLANQTKVYLVADAYRGDRMDSCLEDYFSALAGLKAEKVSLANGDSIVVGANADLLVFNGHNGLMDVSVDVPPSQRDRPVDGVTIACASYDYFLPKFEAAGAFPLLTTLNLLAPEAYVLEQVVLSWARLETAPKVRAAAGRAYHKYQKCGLKGATRLFQAGYK